MSSLDQDRLLAEGSEPVPGPAPTSANRSLRRRVERTAAATAEVAPVPAQRQARARSATGLDGGIEHAWHDGCTCALRRSRPLC